MSTAAAREQQEEELGEDCAVLEVDENLNGDGKPLLKLKDKGKVEPKRINMVLSSESAMRLANLTKKLEPSTQTEAVSKALHLLETFVAAHEAGSKFYLKNPGDKEYTEFNICG